MTCMLNMQCVLELMSMSIYTGLNPFNFTHKPFLQICVWEVAVHL
jgi:superoxide dismutase